MTPEHPDLEELERLAKAATAGPWFAADWNDDCGNGLTRVEARMPEVLSEGQSSIWPNGIRKLCVAETGDGVAPITNAAYIAAFHPLVTSWLISRARRAEELERALIETRRLVAEAALSGFTDEDAVTAVFTNNAAITRLVPVHQREEGR